MVSFECHIIVKDDNDVGGARFKNNVDDDDQVGLVVRGGSNLAEAFYRNDQSSQLPLLTSSPPFPPAPTSTPPPNCNPAQQGSIQSQSTVFSVVSF